MRFSECLREFPHNLFEKYLCLVIGEGDGVRPRATMTSAGGGETRSGGRGQDLRRGLSGGGGRGQRRENGGEDDFDRYDNEV